MSKLFKRNLILSLAWCVAICCLTRSISGQARGGSPAVKETIALTLSASEDMVKTGSPITVTVALKNVSDHEILYWRENTSDAGGSEYKVDVWDDKSFTARETKFGLALKGRSDSTSLTPDTPVDSSGGWLTLKPGEGLTDKLNVSKLYDLSQPGKYSIQIRRFDEETKSFVKSNKITVTVTP